MWMLRKSSGIKRTYEMRYHSSKYMNWIFCRCSASRSRSDTERFGKSDRPTDRLTDRPLPPLCTFICSKSYHQCVIIKTIPIQCRTCEQEPHTQVVVKTTTTPTREFPSGFLVHHLNHSVKWPQRRMQLVMTSARKSSLTYRMVWDGYEALTCVILVS